jgi:hypothetical protein
MGAGVQRGLGSISKQGNRMMRGLLSEAAQTTSQFDSESRRHYQRLEFRRGSSAAVLETARSSSARAVRSHAGSLGNFRGGLASIDKMMECSASPGNRKGEFGKQIMVLV